MSKPLVVVAESISDAGLEVLAARCALDVAVGVDRAELLRRLESAAGLVVRSATVVDAELIAAAPSLQVIGRAGIGVDNIDLEAATDAGVLVVNAPEANTISAAEHTMALLLAQARRVPEADASLRAGSWDRARFKGVELHGKVLGVLGLGRIGTLVAQRASAFGMRIVAYDPYVSEDRARRIGVELADLETVLGSADFITIHLPRNRETEGLLDAQTLRLTKPGVRIVNVARGGIVDEQDLADAVVSGHVAGAAVDVFAEEPTTASPLFALPQVVVTPHLGASTHEAQDKAGLAVAGAVAAALGGDLVMSAVNLDLGPTAPDEIRPFLPLAERLGRIFVAFARGLPDSMEIRVAGKLAAGSVKPLALGALKGALSQVTDEPVTYVNAPRIAAGRGVTVRETTLEDVHDYATVVTLSGIVSGVHRVIAGTVMERKGPVLLEVDGYEIEVPITEHMLLLRNDDVPGVIGRVGTVLGDSGVNIANMFVGRQKAGDAMMMALSIDGTVAPDVVERLLDTANVLAARFIDLT